VNKDMVGLIVLKAFLAAFGLWEISSTLIRALVFDDFSFFGLHTALISLTVVSWVYLQIYT